MAEVLDLQQLLKVQHVQCVAALELGPLQTLLQQLLQGQKDSYDQLQQQQADIDALKAAQADQQQRSEADQGSPTDAGTLEEFKVTAHQLIAQTESVFSSHHTTTLHCQLLVHMYVNASDTSAGLCTDATAGPTGSPGQAAS